MSDSTQTTSMSTTALKEEGSSLGTFTNVSELPPEMDATIAKMENKKDKRDNPCFYLSLVLPDGKYTVQKYTDTIKGTLAEAFEKLGVKQITVGLNVHWVKRREGRSQFDRFFPTKILPDKRSKK